MWLAEVLQTTTLQGKCPPCGPVQGNGSQGSVVRPDPQIAGFSGRLIHGFACACAACPPCGPVQGNGSQGSVVRPDPQIAGFSGRLTHGFACACAACPPCGPVQGNGSQGSVVRPYPQKRAPAVDSPTGSPAPPPPPRIWQVAWGPSPEAQCPTGVPRLACPRGDLNSLRPNWRSIDGGVYTVSRTRVIRTVGHSGRAKHMAPTHASGWSRQPP